MRKIEMLTVLVAAIGAAWLTTLVDNGLGLGWAQTVVCNWEQFGLLNLHGKMVCNPGGFQADTNPDYYPGHRPASMYPVFLCHHLFASTLAGADVGFLAYYAILAAMVLLSIWWLLGRTEPAFWLAAMAVITPGYVRWQTTLDPNLTSVMFGFPFCAAVIGLLRRPAPGWRRVALLFALILFFSALNWTTVFVHAMLFVTLLVLPRVTWRHRFLYAGLTAAFAGAVLVSSLASKMARLDGSGGSGSGLAAMLSSYGWGNTGYGLGLTTRIALMRLLVVNLIGLLPVLIYLGWQGWRHREKWSPVRLVFLLPALVAVVEVLGMRNYFGHHPWMSASFFLMGIVLATVVWKERFGEASVPGTPRWRIRLAMLAATFIYSYVILAIGHAHSEGEISFDAFVREHTARDTTIVIRRDTDPELADVALRLTSSFDRHLMVVPAGSEIRPADPLGKQVILTATPPPGKIIAQITLADHPNPILKTLLDWYVRHVARRRAGDQLEIRPQQYFLYAATN